MGKMYKRCIAFFAALMLLSGSVFTMDALRADANTVIELFRDDFDGYGNNASGAANKDAMIKKGWNVQNNGLNNTRGNYNTGSAYRIPRAGGGYTLDTGNVAGSDAWGDYSIEVTMTYELEDDSAGTTFAGVVGRYQGSGNAGYHLYVQKGSITAKSGALVLQGYSDTKLFEEKATINPLPFNTAFTIRLELSGTILRGYYNGECLITYDTADDAVKYEKGVAGIRKSGKEGCNVIFDDFLVAQTFETSYPEGNYYFNDFASDRDMKEEGWNHGEAAYGEKRDGAWVLKAGRAIYLSGVDGSADWTDYIVESKARILSGDAAVGYASIVARSRDTVNDGYEFRMEYDGEKGTTQLVLYKRGKPNKTLQTRAVDFTLDTDYPLTMAVCENSITCWFDGTLVFECIDTDDPYLKGYAGIRSPGSTAYLSSMYDDFTVREYQEPEVVYPEGYYYYNDFESPKDMKKEGWNHNEETYGEKKDGVYVMNGNRGNYLTGVEGSLEWTDYVVEADVLINDDGSEKQYASIVARSSNTVNDGYEFQLLKEGDASSVALYKRGIPAGKVNNTAHTFAVAVTPGEYNHMKMIVKGPAVICYFNGIRVFEVEDTYKDGKAYEKGCAGLRSPGNTTTATQSYDNFAVRRILDTDIVTEPGLSKQDGAIWFYDDFSAESSFAERGWGTDDVEVHGGAAVPYGWQAVSGIEGAEDWRDYEVEAVVSVDKSAGLAEGQTVGWAAVCSRTLSSATGYEYGIVTSSSSPAYLRLYDRAKKENVMVDKTFAIGEEPHTLTMACVGNVITCYFDNQLVFTAQNDSAKAGYGAIRGSGYPAYFQNFVVRTVTEKHVPVPGAATSPATGDATAYVGGLSLAVFVASAAGLAATICFRRRLGKRQEVDDL